MSVLVRYLALLALALGGVAESYAAQTNDAASVQVSSGVIYTFIGRWDVDRLNQILTVDTPKFFGVNVAYSPARNAVKLYHVAYASVIPERGNKPTVATGLLVVPDTGAASFLMLSFQTPPCRCSTN